MVIGFIGAGKAGCTLGKYFVEGNISVAGYYSKNVTSAKLAAEFTNTGYFEKLEDIVSVSDAVFITTPDGVIQDIWNSIKNYSLKGKCICHCSGAMSSLIFSGINQMGAFGYSIHPLFAINDKLQSYRDISKAYFTIEGSKEYLEYWTEIFSKLGNKVRIISSDKKVLYHSAAVCASNLVTGLFKMASDIMEDCGFDRESSEEALMPLFVNNCLKLSDVGVKDALTGPIERNDVKTVADHINKLPQDKLTVYREISKELLKIAQDKYPDRNYSELNSLLLQ